MTKPKPPKRPWKLGQSGNPVGRPKGSINPSTRLRKMINAEGIVKVLEQQAMDGDVQAARILLERALPIHRATSAPVDVPEIGNASTLPDKAHAVLVAVAAGRVPPDIGAQLIAAIGSVARIVEVDELARRIAVLEANHGQS